MRFLTARRFALVALVPALFLFSAVPGCSNESEGERCGDNPADPSVPGNPNNDDCSAPLICVEANSLIASQANRCCNPNSTIVNDSRCVRSNGTGTTGGTSSGGSGATSGATNGGGGSGGTADIGDASTNDAATAGAADLGAGGN
jgi:uncharacterized membrane protein YgcG